MASLNDVLDDLCAYETTFPINQLCRRFLANLPVEELNSRIRLGFQVEQAFWFYDDFYRSELSPFLPKLTLKTFCERLIMHCPFELPALKKEEASQLIDEFYQYKAHVPTCGAIILNETLSKCLMVRGFSGKPTWGFPKGKIGKDELPVACAIREVLEETSFDITSYVREEDFIQIESNGQPIRLYIIAGISENTNFMPQTRREIRNIEWHPIKVMMDKGGPYKYFNVMPFMSQLKRRIRQYKRQVGNVGQSSVSDTEILTDGTPQSITIGSASLMVIDDLYGNRFVARIQECLNSLHSCTFDMGSLMRAYCGKPLE